MDILIKTVISIFGGLGVLGLVILFILFFPEKVKLIQASITQLFGRISFWARKSTIKNRVEGSCDAALKEFHKEMPDISIPNLVVEWVNGDDFDTRVKDNEAVVLLRYSKNDTLNIVTATTAYVRDAFLIHAKQYLSESFRKGLDLSIIRFVLSRVKNNNKSVVSRFVEDNCEAIQASSAIINKIESINDAGLFTRLMIRELDCYGNALLGRVPAKEHADEADDFLDYLYKIATREPDEYTQLAFVRPDIRVGVLLVAKLDNYVQNGLRPYLNRIKRGFALGVDTFYLLARDKHISILDDVFKGLMLTGNFLLLKKPKIYYDRQRREVKCYCIKVDKEGSINNAYDQINKAMAAGDELEAIITHIREDRITISFNELTGYINKQNFSSKDISSPTDYFLVGSSIYVKPIEINGDGDVEFSIAGTASDPMNLFSAYKIGMQINAEVTYADDTFVKFIVPGSNTTAVAFRDDLTYSRFLLLHKKFKIGEIFTMIVKELEPENNNLILSLHDLKDPWADMMVEKGDTVRLEICRKDANALVGELNEGLTTVLHYRDLSWNEKQAESIRKSIRLGDSLDCIVDRVDKKQRVVYVTLKKTEDNPYVSFFEDNRGKDVQALIVSDDECGVYGQIETMRLFIPISETCRGKTQFTYKIGETVSVRVKDISERKDTIIGSFIPFIHSAIDRFKQAYSEGDVIENLKLEKKEKYYLKFRKKHNNDVYDLYLYISDIASEGFVDDLPSLFSHVKSLPLIIKKIDSDRDRIFLSLKDNVKKGDEASEVFEYGQEYEGIIISRNRSGYRALALKQLREVQLHSQEHYNTGDSVMLIPERLSTPLSFMDKY